MNYKIIQDQNNRGHTVPVTTPDDFFATEAAKWEFREKNLQRVAESIREINLQKIESSFELETDEFQTSREKALPIT